MSMAFSCASVRLHGRVGAVQCRAAALARPSGCSYPSARRWTARGIRCQLLPPRASADGGSATTSDAAVVVPEAGEVAGSAEEAAAVIQSAVLQEKGGDVADVGGSGGDGKFPPGGGGGGGGGDGDNGAGGGGADGDSEGDDEFGPILSFEQVVQEVEKRGVSLPSLPADMIEAAKNVGIQKLLLLRYLDMQVCWKGLLFLCSPFGLRCGFNSDLFCCFDVLGLSLAPWSCR